MHKGGIFGFVFLCFFFSLSFGSVESYRNSLFIFLSDKGGSSNPYVKSGIYDYVSTRITGDIGNLYLYSIDVSSRIASDLSSIFSNHESNSVFAKALEYWFENSSDSLLLNWKNRCGNKCALTDLKKYVRIFCLFAISSFRKELVAWLLVNISKEVVLSGIFPRCCSLIRRMRERGLPTRLFFKVWMAILSKNRMLKIFLHSYR